MDSTRPEALAKLLSELTQEQLKALRMIIRTADSQGDYDLNFDPDGSFFSDGVTETLDQLAEEFQK